MSYELVDPVIRAWIQQNGLVLFDEFAGEVRRFWYVSKESECLQVSIDPPSDRDVTVHVSSVETTHDEDMHLQWTAPISELPQILKVAHAAMREWFERGMTHD